MVTLTGEDMSYQLGRKPSPFDSRDYNLKDFIPRGLGKLTLSRNRQWNFPKESLDQQDTPHCVGMGIADFGICEPTSDNFTSQDGHNFYYMCKILDGEPGQENGSCVRTAAKVLKNLGRINAYAFAPMISMVTWWLLLRGPIIAGTVWTSDMFEPDGSNIIHATGQPVGGHCYVLTGVKDMKYYTIQNSWGNGWGVNGSALISIIDFTKLFLVGGEALASVELPLK
jgi:hypothetical protein